MDLRSKDHLNWLLHLHFVRREYVRCEGLLQRSEGSSDYGHYLRGLIYLQKDGDARSALELFSSQPGNHLCLRACLRCLVLLGQHQKVHDLIRERGLVADPSDWQIWNLIGTSFFHLGNFPLAKDALQRATQATNRSEPFLALSKCYMADGDVKSAVFVLRKASELAPEDTAILVRLGILLRSSGMTAKGADKLMQLQHKSATTHGDLQLALATGAVLQETRHDVDGALYRYKMANKFESSGLWNNVALCFASRKKLVGAVSCLFRARYLNPLDWRISYNLGLLHLHLGQFASSFHFLKASASTSSGYPLVVSLIGVVLESLRDVPGAAKAHAAAAQAAASIAFPIPILNNAVFLLINNGAVSKDQIVDLLLEFEKCWVIRRQSDSDFDADTMRLATKLAVAVHVAHHMAWIQQPPTEQLAANS